MHDVKALRETPDAYVRGWSSRGVADAEAVVDELLSLDRDLRAAQTAFQEAQARRNESSKLIGQAKGRKDEAEAQRLMAEVESLKGAIAEAQERERTLGEQLRDRLASLPNLAAEDVPEGEDESGNVEARRWGDPAQVPAARLNAPKDHADLGEALGMMDFEAAARMSGSRFVVLKRDLARLERAIGQFMLDMQTGEHGYTEVSPPLLVRDQAMFGTGQLPKFEEDLFQTAEYDLTRLEVGTRLFEDPDILRAIKADVEASRHWLIPTAEVSLTNLVREQITGEEELPMRLTALTHCFRAEAGASGRDTRGMIRQHQFQKVELVSITTPEQSDEEHERMTSCAEAVLKRLELPFRTMLLCRGDMGFSARKTYDLEVWLPSQGAYREISSCSNCGDFQARRMDARVRKAGEKGTRYAHTLNGSGLAVGRTLVAVMENYQDEGGRIAIPEALRPYMGGVSHIGGRA
ncbi:MAG TPA: serine--tRNA ligase [Caulobacteraceae bacterium]|nr:serine--tRNA ligase [Caulobacteraceae bacterium]